MSARMKPEGIQLEFRCPDCGTSGLSPEISEDEAIAVILKDLSIPCPRCCAVIEITESIARVRWKVRAAQTGESVSLLVRGALKAEVERRLAKKGRRAHAEGQNGSAHGSLSPRSDKDR